MYTMCTGHSPFRASGTHAVLKRVIEASPRPIREVNDEIPEWLCDIIAKLHAKKPADRFQSAKEVADLLQQHLAHLQQPGIAPRPGALVAPARVDPRVRAASRAAWPFAVAFGIVGALFGSVCWLIDPDKLSILQHGTSMLANAVYAAGMGAAVGMLLGFLNVLFFARMEHERRQGGRTPSTNRTGSGRWVLVPICVLAAYLLFLAGGYIFSDAARLYMLDMGEVRIDDFHHDDFDQFMLVSDASPEFVNGAPLPAHVPLFVDPGTYHIRAVGKHGQKVLAWEIKNPREALGVATIQESEECTLEIRRGQRISVSVSKWAPADADPAGGPWEKLFDGKDLTGWQPLPGQPGTWQVKDKILVGRDGPGQLYSLRDDYQNFHLRAEVAISKGADADIYFRSKKPASKPTAKSSGSAGYVLDLKEGPDQYLGPISFLDPKTNSWTTYGTNSTVKPDEWFTLDVIADRNHMMTKVNGELVLGFIEDLNVFQKGHIALQVWKPETVVKFRKIEIRELPAIASTPEQQAKEDATRLTGEWVLRRGRADQQPLAVQDAGGTKLSLRDGKFVLPIRDESGYPWALTGVYSIDAAMKQLTFNVRGQGEFVRCGYRIDGDVLVLEFPDPKDGDGSTELFASAFGDSRTASLGHLKSLGVAMLQYAEAHNNTLPPAAIADPMAKDGKPLLSWRVALLPQLGQDALYQQFKLNEPWDSEHNKKLIEKMPPVFETPFAGTKPGMTHYRVFVGPGTAFEPRPATAKGLSLLDFADGLSNTLLVVEAADSVIWTKPDDLPYDPKKPLPKLGVYPGGGHVLVGDGSVRRVSSDATEEGVRGAIERNDGKGISAPQFPHLPRRGPALHLEFQRSAAAVKSTVVADRDGFVPLFNGNDLTAWHTVPTQPGNWRVEKGILIGSGPDTHSHLYSDRGDYEDFHLRAEVRINTFRIQDRVYFGNSGIYFRSSGKPDLDMHPSGYEAQILAGTTSSSGAQEHNLTGSLYGLKPYEKSIKGAAAGDWFTLEVIARGPRITIKVNGLTTVDEFEDAKYRRGHFALQQIGAGTIVEFRKIEIKELAIGPMPREVTTPSK
jgi:hypothetical protein